MDLSNEDVAAGMFKYEILLPSNSAIKYVEGPWKLSKRLAKESACLKACRQLHEAGGLDDHLIPPRPESDAEIIECKSAESTRSTQLYPTAKVTSLVALPLSSLPQYTQLHLYSVTNSLEATVSLGLASTVDLSRILDANITLSTHERYESPSDSTGKGIFELPFCSDGGTHALRAQYSQTIQCSRDELMLLQTTFGIIMSGALTANHFNIFTAPAAFLSPFFVVPITVGNELDWNEIHRICREARVMKENTVLAKFTTLEDFRSSLAPPTLLISTLRPGLKLNVVDVICGKLADLRVKHGSSDQTTTLYEYCRFADVEMKYRQSSDKHPIVLYQHATSNRTIHFVPPLTKNKVASPILQGDLVAGGTTRFVDVNGETVLLVAHKRDVADYLDPSLSAAFIHPIGQDVARAASAMSILLAFVEEVRFRSRSCFTSNILIVFFIL